MINRIIFNIEEGSFEQGFPTTIQIWGTSRHHYREIRGKFPPAPQLRNDYHNWQDIYRRLGAIQRIIVPPSQITNVSKVEECKAAANALETSLNEWLNQPSVRTLERRLLKIVGATDRVQFILKTRSPELRRLPWHLWSFFQECYPQAEVTLCAETEPFSKQLRSPVRILAILGSQQKDETIHFAADLTELEKLPGAIVERVETLQTLYDRLRDQTKAWDILFFAGHSLSYAKDQGGEIIFEQGRLPLSHFHNALNYAVKNGLKLAIFNSCDGLGLAQELADLKIPYLIVMREPIPDVVAQKFAQDFLKNFAQGESFHTAVQFARSRLKEEMERTKASEDDGYPCASWLPIICQNPLAPELKYPQPIDWKKIALLAAGVAIAAIVTTVSVDEIVFRHRISQGEKILILSVKTPAKVMGVQALSWKDYSQAVSQFEQSLRQNRNDPETVIYLNNARIGDRPTFKVAAVVPIGSNLDVAQEMLRGVAHAQDEINLKGGIQGKPLKVVIANDANQPEIAKRIAATLVKDPQILAVIGHNASDASVAAAPTYNQGGLVMITPTSFSDKLSSSGKYIFRMVPSIWYVADKLAAYISQNTPQARVAICSDVAAPDNESFRNQFTTALLGKKSLSSMSPVTFPIQTLTPNPRSPKSAIAAQRPYCSPPMSIESAKW